MTKLLPENERPIRRYETLYFGNRSMRRKSLAFMHGFPKTEDGSIDGAVKAIAKGWLKKVQCIDRWTYNNEVRWTAEAGDPVPGVKLIPVKVSKGDPIPFVKRKEN